MTRPLVRAAARLRCNLSRGRHRLDCSGHERRHSRRSRAEAQAERRARERAEKRSKAQRAESPVDKLLRSPFDENEELLADLEIGAPMSTDKRRLGPLARSLSGVGIAIGQPEPGTWRAYRLVNLPAGQRGDPHTRRDYFGPTFSAALEAIAWHRDDLYGVAAAA